MAKPGPKSANDLLGPIIPGGAQSVADLTVASSGGHSIIDLDGAAVDGVGNEVTVLTIQTLSSSDFIFA
jgi:hypothetical protein